jgi:hypothetical protein
MAEIRPAAEQMERVQRLGGAIGAAAGYLAKSCPTDIPELPIVRLQMMESQIEVLTMAVDIIHTHCPNSMPQSAVARLEAIEARLDATWRAVLSIQVALEDFQSGLSDDQKNRFKAMTFAAQ